MRKIWDVEIGHNWCKVSVEARNYIEAGKKALRLAAPVLREEKFVSVVELVREIKE